MSKFNPDKMFSKNGKVGKIFFDSLVIVVVWISISGVWSTGTIDIANAQPVGNQPAPAPTGVATTQTLQSQLKASENPNSSAFKIAVCDGPTLPTKDLMAKAKEELGRDYIPCDFNAVILLVQHLINIMMVLGVLVAILMFSYAGYLLVSGKEDNIKHAKSIFPKVFTGFIIMLSAWFVVFQILSWLTNNGGFKTLLGA